MYNQYMSGDDFIPLDGEQPEGRRQRPREQQRPQSAPPCRPGNDLVGEVTGGLSKLLDGVQKHFSLEKLDTGDILLVLIILFLYLEGDNLELVITLGLLLLLGLGDDDQDQA